MQSICNNFVYSIKNKEFKMFPPLHNIIETRPSNNIKYEGETGIYKTGKYSRKSTGIHFRKISLYKQVKDK
jgi:hypothetical protein